MKLQNDGIEVYIILKVLFYALKYDSLKTFIILHLGVHQIFSLHSVFFYLVTIVG